MVGKEMSVPDVMAEIWQDSVFYEESVGGVTFSGGEPLMQYEFLHALLEECRIRGLHTAVDTCGFGCTDHLLSVAALANLILYDLKLMDDAAHRRYTGVSNGPILANLEALDQIHQNVWVRVPVIPGVNDDAGNLGAIARFAAGIHAVREVTLLPYHRTGVQKHKRLGKPYALIDVRTPSTAEMEKAAEHFRALGLRTRISGS
jgi:pyruvate formate lyase activating enzyme